MGDLIRWIKVADRVTGVNAIVMASLHESPDILDELLPWNAPMVAQLKNASVPGTRQNTGQQQEPSLAP